MGWGTSVHRLAQSVYDRYLREMIQSKLPNQIGMYNGVAVRDRALLDASDEWADYEAPLVTAIRERVCPGDRVVIVGGGKGVSTVVAGRQAGVEGSVVCFEGNRNQVDLVRETVRLNRANDRTEVRHAVVGPNVSVWGSSAGAATVHPADLPECDVLELDCEGAENGILSEMSCTPGVIVVETHPNLGVNETETKTLLNRRGYTIVDRTLEDETKGISILTAVQTSDGGLIG